MMKKSNKIKCRILISPNSFKESLSAIKIAQYLRIGLKKSYPEAILLEKPIADGGDGTLDILIYNCGGKYQYKTVSGPLGDKIRAKYGILNDNKTAVIEMAQASGLKLIPVDKRNPMKTSSIGTGELIKSALNKNIKKIIIGVGGSATVDLGIGMANALGVKFYDNKNRIVYPSGGELIKIQKIDLSNIDKRIYQTEIIVLSDVHNPLLGSQGSVSIYAPQKGATYIMLPKLEQGMIHMSKLIKNQLHIDISKLKGGGAAGGLAAGLVCFCGGKINPGIDFILDLIKIDDILPEIDMIITGEGKLDEQSIYGKAAVGIAQRAKKYDIPVIGITGYIGAGANKLHRYGIDAMFSIQAQPMSLEESISSASQLIQSIAEEIGRLLRIIRR